MCAGTQLGPRLLLDDWFGERRLPCSADSREGVHVTDLEDEAGSRWRNRGRRRRWSIGPAELKTELPDRIDEFVRQTGWPGWHGRGWWSSHGWWDGPGWWGAPAGPVGLGGLDVAAEALGLDEDALWDALRDGNSIADVATEQGVHLQVVQDALVSEATERIDAALADGRIGEDRQSS